MYAVQYDDQASVELWRFAADATATLPAASVQVLGGALTAAGVPWKVGDRRDVTVQVEVTAGAASILLVTTWR